MRMKNVLRQMFMLCDIIEDMSYSYGIIFGNTSHYVGNEIDI
jgi:hypothetical protein